MTFRFVQVLFLFCTSASLCAEEPVLRWWKGNLHTHSLWSDGDDYPEMICAWYKEHGYHFLALSDHNIIADHERWVSIHKNGAGHAALAKYLGRFGSQWVEQRNDDGEDQVRLKMLSEFRKLFQEPERFLLIPSEEITDHFRKIPIHLNATNVQELIEPQGGRSVVEVMQRNVDAVLAQHARTGVPMLPHINHPNFGWAITAEELAQVEHDRFFEIYNGHPMVHNEGDEIHASVERVWDILLTERHENGLPPHYGLATDDSHNYHGYPDKEKQSHPGRGWVMVRAPSLSAENIIVAIEAGDFYASSGVILKDVRCEMSGISLKIEAEPGIVYRTAFIGTRKGYDRTREALRDAGGGIRRVTQRYSSEVGAVLATVEGDSASYLFKGDELYVRARVTSSKLKADPYVRGEFEQAWTQSASARPK